MSEKEKDTEQRIKDTARRIFQERGFSATKTRDIAEEAGINLALLNYYFRSKQKLFDIIMLEALRTFFSGMIPILNDESTSIHEKVELFVDKYIDMLSENPNVPSFIMNTVRENPDDFIKKVGVLDQAKSSVFVRQFMEAFMKGDLPPINPIHFMLNLMSLVVFPFLAQPMIMAVSGMPNDAFQSVVQDRKRLIPLWIKAMLNVN